MKSGTSTAPRNNDRLRQPQQSRRATAQAEQAKRQAAKAEVTAKVKGGKVLTPEQLNEYWKKIQPRAGRFGNQPRAAFDIHKATRLSQLPKSLQRNLNLIDSKNREHPYPDNFVAEGDKVFLQTRQDGTPDFFIPRKSNIKTREVALREVDPEQLAMIKKALPDIELSDLTGILELGECEITRASELGIPVDQEAKFLAVWGEVITKKKGEDAYFARKTDPREEVWTIGADEDGQPIRKVPLDDMER